MQSSSQIKIHNSYRAGAKFFVKRVADILLSSLGIIAILPVLITVAATIKFDSKGPVFFKQKRIGKDGLPFYMYKFRSMVVDAEELKHKLQQKNEADGPIFKIRNDPRITRVGGFIRKYSLDELPQLLNVIKGDMSLVGPRPALPEEVSEYSAKDRRRLEVIPGITGLWQVSGRSELSFEQWVNLDIYYIDNWSLLLDVKILCKTVPVVIFGKGSY